MAITPDGARIYATPQDGLGAHQIAKCLNRDTLDIGQLCADVEWDDTNNQWVRTNKINKWAKWKPVRFGTSLEEPNATERASLDVNHGFYALIGIGSRRANSIPSWYSASNAMAKMANFWGNNVATDAPDSGLVREYWGYLPPTTDDKYRYLDFTRPGGTTPTDGYYRDAQAPLGSGIQHKVTIGGKLTLTFPTGAIDDAVLKYSDFKYGNPDSPIGGDEMYFGVMMVRMDGSNLRTTFMTHRTVMGNGDNGLKGGVFTLHTAPNAERYDANIYGTWQVFPFLCTERSVNPDTYDSTPLSNVTCVALLPSEQVVISRNDAYADYEITALSAVRNSNRIDYSFNIENNDTEDYENVQVTVDLLNSNGQSLKSIVLSDSEFDTIEAVQTKTFFRSYIPGAGDPSISSIYAVRVTLTAMDDWNFDQKSSEVLVQ